MTALATWIVPPVYLGQITGVAGVMVGVRVVKCQLLATAYKFPRKYLPSVLPSDYTELAELVRSAVRLYGTEIDPLLPKRQGVEP